MTRLPHILIDELDLPGCRLIKLDVEGMEADALAGAAETVRRYKPVIYFENHDTDIGVEIAEFLNREGYSCHWHTPQAFNAENFNVNAENMFGDACERNILASPPGVTPPDALRPLGN